MTKYSLVLLLIIGALFASKPVLASITNGTIDGSNKYAWAENVGWIDFGSSYGNVQITDSALTGYAWSDTIGWINLAPSGSGVVNDSTGNLSGYAWSENAGWIDFKPTGGGVTIDSTGIFSGYAWGENIGWLVFNCSTTASCATVDYKVSTDYRPAPYRNSGSILIGNISPTAPAGGFQVSSPSSSGGSVMTVGGLGSQTLVTSSQKIDLNFKAGIDTKKIAISNSPDFKYANLEKYDSSKKWTLTDGYGQKKVYVKFYNQWGYSTEPIVIDVVYSADGQKNTPQMADNNNSFFSDGSLVKEFNKPAVYKIENGEKRPILNGEVFEALGYNWQDIKEVANLDFYKLGYTIDSNSSNDNLGKTKNQNKKIAKYSPVAKVLGEKINKVIPPGPPPANYPEPTSGPNNKSDLPATKFTYGLYQGLADTAVRQLQILLASQADVYPEARITGYFGPLTKSAVQRFQLKYDVIKDSSDPGAGYVGPLTRNKLTKIFDLK